ncbi:glyoxalase superfamily protein [Acuticoccus sp. I52.16.1]|uniref:glyoxalase superfamily protein n=1 Tax=Acuticoccus sp. I52.16.1 TaxID=2928472 RepID=UPI001FD4AD7E|nr:glyoxalase superfamily protein [Acuticoccus sp. I52.16.1]UOM35723.1 glyoxalase superfamily protein [Acuticoccus sp. I52.16.1]
MTTTLHTRDHARARARALRAELARAGHSISHAKALERVAHEEGYASWNALCARLSNAPDVPLALGQRVAGRYLGQAFSGTVHTIRTIGAGEAFEIELVLDAPIDVVTFPTFSFYRSRVRGTISPGGVSFTKTSDGVPHLVVAGEGDGRR